MIVLDASVWVSALRPQNVNYRVSDQWLAQWTASGAGLAVPTIFLAEVGGANSRRAAQPGLGRQAVSDIVNDPTIQLVAIDQALAEAAARLAADVLIRGTDAVYVALAEQMGIPLVTWDQEQLTRAASVITVQVPTI